MKKEYILYPVCKLLDVLAVKHFYSGAPIFMYHSISDKDSRLAVTPDNFRKQMEYLKSLGYKSLSVKEFLNAENKTKKNFMVAFDDGFQDNFDNAFPILKSDGFVATIFISTDFMSAQSNFATNAEDKNFAMLSEPEIKTLENAGWSVCNHFAGHKDLKKLSDGEISLEYDKAKNKLESIINNKENAKFVSYPHNRYDKRVLEVMEKAGVAYGFSGQGYFYRHGDNKLTIPRIEISRDVSFLKFKLVLSPTFNLLKRLFKK